MMEWSRVVDSIRDAWVRVCVGGVLRVPSATSSTRYKVLAP